MKLQDFIISNFNGGLVKNKSDLEMARNEFKNTLNLDLDEVGKIKRRKGICQCGDTKSGIFDESFVFLRHTDGQAPMAYHLVIDRASDGTLYRVIENYTTLALTTASTVITMGNIGGFAASGTVEINGDLIAYTGTSGATLTGVTGILKSHPAYSEVRQLSSIGATGVDTRAGAYFSVLNNLCFINGRVGSATYDGSTVSAVADADEPNAIFATNFRERIYLAGSAATSGDPRRVFFSDAGDSTSWDANNYFDVEDDRGEPVTGFKEGENVLLIFKTNSIFMYDEVQLKQTVWNVGAYHHKVIQKINDTIFTFCPTGVWKTNGYSAKKISQPVEKYLRLFKPDYDQIAGKLVTNCFAGQFGDKYLLYVGSIPDPDDETTTLSDVVLVYDTLKNNWTVYDSFTSFSHFGSFKNFGYGQLSNSVAGGSTMQSGECLFAGNTGGKYYRLFDGRFYDNQATRSYRGGDYIPNLISNSVGNPISTVLETKFYEVGNPGTLKTFGFLELLIDQGEFNVAYKLDKGDTITDWISLGVFSPSLKKKRLKDNKGYKVAFKITSNTLDTLSTLNGIILKGIETQEVK